jgi:hypothetical protein
MTFMFKIEPIRTAITPNIYGPVALSFVWVACDFFWMSVDSCKLVQNDLDSIFIYLRWVENETC